MTPSPVRKTWIDRSVAGSGTADRRVRHPLTARGPVDGPAPGHGAGPPGGARPPGGPARRLGASGETARGGRRRGGRRSASPWSRAGTLRGAGRTLTASLPVPAGMPVSIPMLPPRPIPGRAVRFGRSRAGRRVRRRSGGPVRGGAVRVSHGSRRLDPAEARERRLAETAAIWRTAAPERPPRARPCAPFGRVHPSTVRAPRPGCALGRSASKPHPGAPCAVSAHGRLPLSPSPRGRLSSTSPRGRSPPPPRHAADRLPRLVVRECGIMRT